MDGIDLTPSSFYNLFPVTDELFWKDICDPVYEILFKRRQGFRLPKVTVIPQERLKLFTNSKSGALGCVARHKYVQSGGYHNCIVFITYDAAIETSSVQP